MTEEAAQVLREAEEEPRDPQEVWEWMRAVDEDVDWDLHRIVLAIRDEGDDQSDGDRTNSQ